LSLKKLFFGCSSSSSSSNSGIRGSCGSRGVILY